MRTPLQPQRARCDSVLDQQLTLAQQDDLYTRIDHGMTYADASAFLRESHGLKLSAYAVWKWVARRRRLSSDLTFATLLETIRADKAQAKTLSREIGDAQELHDATVLMLSQALFETRRNNDLRGMAEIAKLFTGVLGAVNQSRRVKISARAVQVARDRFEFDAAEIALRLAAELQEINRSELDDRAKIARAVERMFGAALAGRDTPAALPAAVS